MTGFHSFRVSSEMNLSQPKTPNAAKNHITPAYNYRPFPLLQLLFPKITTPTKAILSHLQIRHSTNTPPQLPPSPCPSLQAGGATSAPSPTLLPRRYAPTANAVKDLVVSEGLPKLHIDNYPVHTTPGSKPGGWRWPD